MLPIPLSRSYGNQDQHFKVNWNPLKLILRGPHKKPLSERSNDNINGSKNITHEMNSHFYTLHSVIPIPIKFRWFFLELNSQGQHSSFAFGDKANITAWSSPWPQFPRSGSLCDLGLVPKGYGDSFKKENWLTVENLRKTFSIFCCCSYKDLCYSVIFKFQAVSCCYVWNVLYRIENILVIVCVQQ